MITEIGMIPNGIFDGSGRGWMRIRDARLEMWSRCCGSKGGFQKKQMEPFNAF